MEGTMTDEKCEGFTNYATFGVAVTLENDRELAGKVRAAVESAERKMTPSVYLRDSLKDLVEELCEVGSEHRSDMAAQMIQAGISEVDWRDLVNHFRATMGRDYR